MMLRSLSHRLVLFVLFLFGAIISSYFLLTQQTPSTNSTTNPVVQAFEQPVIRSFNAKQALQHLLKAKKLTQYQDGKRLIEQSILIKFTSNEAPQWRLQSDLIVTHDMETYHFPQGLVATNLINQSNVTLRNATYHQPSETLHSDQLSVIHGKNWKSESQGIKLNLNRDTLNQPEGVKDTYEN